MANILVSILIPLYNEEQFIETLLESVTKAPYPAGVDFEMIVVDDCSTDGSARAVDDFVSRNDVPIQLLRHKRNMGKGAAIRTALHRARGELALIQDADLEYSPEEYPRLLGPLLKGKADAVFGSRFLTFGERRVLFFWHSVANRLLTLMCNVLTDLNMTDVETGYKAFRTSLVKSIPLRSNRFGIETELTVKLARRKARIFETPISYYGRTYDEGKKVGLRDAFEAVWVMLHSRFAGTIYNDAGLEILEALALAPHFNRWMADTVRPFLGERILEIGAGIGNLTQFLATNKTYYAATDIDSERLQTLRNRFGHRSHIEVKECDVRRSDAMKYFAGRVNTVICLNVLEHVAEADEAARNLYDVLEEGGRAIVLVPQDERLFGTLDRALGHFLRYSELQLRERLTKAGFFVETIFEFNRVSRPGWYVTGKVLRRPVLARFPLRCFDALVWLWRKIDGRLPWPAVSIIAIARKGPAR